MDATAKMAAIAQQQAPAADPSLVNALYNTFNPNQQARHAAEAMLAAAHAQPGYLHALVSVLLSDPAALPLPQGAQPVHSRFVRQAGETLKMSFFGGLAGRWRGSCSTMPSLSSLTHTHTLSLSFLSHAFAPN